VSQKGQRQSTSDVIPVSNQGKFFHQLSFSPGPGRINAEPCRDKVAHQQPLITSLQQYLEWARGLPLEFQEEKSVFLLAGVFHHMVSATGIQLPLDRGISKPPK